MLLAGIDPSYKRTGLAIYRDGVLFIRKAETESNSDKSFQTVWNDALGQVNRVVMELMDKGEPYNCILSECPPPQGNFSPGLYALDSMMFSELRRVSEEIRVVYPNYIGHVHGKKSYSKTESVELARTLLDSLKDSMEVDMVSKRISHDESEAVIILCRLFVLKNMFVDNLKMCKGLFSDKDKLLCKSRF